MARKVLHLADEDCWRLERVVKFGENWRERQRAETLLLLGQGKFAEDVAAKLGIHVRTVGTTRSLWLAEGMASLADRPRSGAPKKLTPEQVQRLAEWARSEPLTATSLLARHREHGGEAVHVNTLVASLKASGFVWKRTRHSLKKAVTKPPFDKRA